MEWKQPTEELRAAALEANPELAQASYQNDDGDWFTPEHVAYGEDQRWKDPKLREAVDAVVFGKYAKTEGQANRLSGEQAQAALGGGSSAIFIDRQDPQS